MAFRPVIPPPAGIKEKMEADTQKEGQSMKRLNCSSCRWLRAIVLPLCAVVFLVGQAVGQDYEAVEKRLDQAVAEGELSLEQAAAMMEALRDRGAHAEHDEEHHEDHGDHHRDHGEHDDDHEHAGHDHDAASSPRHSVERFNQWIEYYGQDLKAKVQAGELTEAQAKKEWNTFTKTRLARSLRQAVQQGHLTEEAAGDIMAKVKAPKKKVESPAPTESPASTEMKLRQMVQEGKITEEGARKRLAAYRRFFDERRGGASQKKTGEKHIEEEKDVREEHVEKSLSREEFEKLQVRIRTALREGDITPREARMKLAAIRKQRADQHEEHADHAHEEHEHADRESDKPRDGRREREVEREVERKSEIERRWHDIELRIESAVKRGDITRDQAIAKYRELRARFGR